MWGGGQRPGEPAGRWFLRRRRTTAALWLGLHAAAAIGLLLLGLWLKSTAFTPGHRAGPKAYIGTLAAFCFAGYEVFKSIRRIPAAVDVERDPAVRRVRSWGDLDAVAAEIVQQLGTPVAIAGPLVFTQDFLIDKALDVRRIEDIEAISRVDEVDKAYGVIERDRTRVTSLVFSDATIPLSRSVTGHAGSIGIGTVLAHCQRRAPWLAASLGVDPARLRPPPNPAPKPNRAQGPVVRNPPTRRPPPRAS